jgi:hypothetical protein
LEDIEQERVSPIKFEHWLAPTLQRLRLEEAAATSLRQDFSTER